MPRPLIPTELTNADQPGLIQAIEHVDGGIRETGFHAHAAGQLIGSRTGALLISASSGSWVVPATQAVWVPPHISHALRSAGPFRGWSVYFGERACGGLPGKPQALHVRGLLQACVERAVLWSGPPREVAQTRVVEVMLDEIAAAPVGPFGLPNPKDPLARRVGEAVLADLADCRPLEAWATWAGMSPRTLSRRFSIETGFAFAEWRRRARVLQAVERLAVGTSVTEVAIDMGYDNLSAFIAMFRRITGSTPGHYTANAR